MDQAKADQAKADQAKADQAKAVNDAAKGGVDRLGYRYYAMALHKVLSDCDAPLCVGLYGR